jgi:hypothetical protein
LAPIAVKVVLGPPTHKFTGVVTVGADGSAFTLAVIAERLPSQLPALASNDWLTKKTTELGEPVVMAGAAAKGLPPEAAVYHFRLVPVAVKVVPGPPTHKFTGVITIGADGSALTFTVIAERLPSQLPALASND